MKNSSKNLINLLAYVALVIVALLMIVDVLAHFNVLAISGGVLLNALNTLKNLCILIVIGFVAYEFLPGNKKWVKILFTISILIIIAGTVLMWI